LKQRIPVYTNEKQTCLSELPLVSETSSMFSLTTSVRIDSALFAFCLQQMQE